MSVAGSATHSHQESIQFTSLKPPSPHEMALLNDALGLSDQELANVQRQSELAAYLQKNAPEYFGQAAQSGALGDQRFQQQINDLRGSVDQSRADISSAAENALRLGEADISNYTQLGLENIRDTLAPSRGLQPGDSPILGLGSELTREALNQQGQLVRSVRGQEASQLATLPFERGMATTQLQAQLQQDAFNNRLALAGGAANLGLGYSVNAPLAQVYGTLTGAREAAATTRFRGQGGSVSGSASYSYGGGGGGGGGG